MEPTAVAALLARVDCPRCRGLVEEARRLDPPHAPEVRVVGGRPYVDLGYGAGYLVPRHFGLPDGEPVMRCPDCRRTVALEEYRNTGTTWLEVDAPAQGAPRE